MKRVVRTLTGVAIALFAVAGVRLGGWAVVTAESVPEYLVVGKPSTLTFAVRQHAVTLLSDLTPKVVATSGRREFTSKATSLGNGRYRAELTAPEAGDWRIVIESGFGRSRGTLLPIKATTTTPTGMVATDVDRGRVLFAARGCVTCHVHGGVDVPKGELSTFGPELTDRRFAAGYLAEFLEDPSIKPPTPGGSSMPRPGITRQDIPLLVAFINSERRTAAK